MTFLLNCESKVSLICSHFHHCNFVSWQDVMTQGYYSCQLSTRAEQLQKCPINLSHNPVPKHFHHLVYSNTLIQLKIYCFITQCRKVKWLPWCQNKFPRNHYPNHLFLFLCLLLTRVSNQSDFGMVLYLFIDTYTISSSLSLVNNIFFCKSNEHVKSLMVSCGSLLSNYSYLCVPVIL